MVTLNSAENALKSVYLGVVANQLNVNANPLLGKIRQTTKDVWGKDIIKLAPYGINGGIGAGDEDGALPTAFGNNYVQFKTTLKNLYGNIEISDKAIRASQNDAGAFVNLLNDEMEGLIKASSFNLGRMLYGDGSGLLATAGANGVLDSVKNLIEGLVVTIVPVSGNPTTARITYVNRSAKTITLSSGALSSGDKLYVQGSKDKEITGLGAIFDANATSIYGLTKASYPWLNPYVNANGGKICDGLIQTAIDSMEEMSGSTINYISCASDVRRMYQEYLGAFKRNIDVMELVGGYKAISYNGIPVVADRFVEDGTMYLLNTNDFVLHQLCDWKWLEGEDGRIIRQKPGYPTYNATLVKYADLICDRPNGQAKISGITSATATAVETTISTQQ